MWLMHIFQIDDDYDMDDDYDEDEDYEGYDDGRSKTPKENNLGNHMAGRWYIDELSYPVSDSDDALGFF